MKDVQAFLSGRDGRESSVHCCGGSVWLVEACLYAGMTS